MSIWKKQKGNVKKDPFDDSRFENVNRLLRDSNAQILPILFARVVRRENYLASKTISNIGHDEPITNDEF